MIKKFLQKNRSNDDKTFLVVNVIQQLVGLFLFLGFNLIVVKYFGLTELGKFSKFYSLIVFFITLINHPYDLLLSKYLYTNNGNLLNVFWSIFKYRLSIIIALCLILTLFVFINYPEFDSLFILLFFSLGLIMSISAHLFNAIISSRLPIVALVITSIQMLFYLILPLYFIDYFHDVLISLFLSVFLSYTIVVLISIYFLLRLTWINSPFELNLFSDFKSFLTLGFVDSLRANGLIVILSLKLSIYDLGVVRILFSAIAAFTSLMPVIPNALVLLFKENKLRKYYKLFVFILFSTFFLWMFLPIAIKIVAAFIPSFQVVQQYYSILYLVILFSTLLKLSNGLTSDDFDYQLKSLFISLIFLFFLWIFKFSSLSMFFLLYIIFLLSLYVFFIHNNKYLRLDLLKFIPFIFITATLSLVTHYFNYYVMLMFNFAIYLFLIYFYRKHLKPFTNVWNSRSS